MQEVHIILLSLLLIGFASVHPADVKALEMDARLIAVEQVYRTEGAAEALPEFERLLLEFRVPYRGSVNPSPSGDG